MGRSSIAYLIIEHNGSSVLCEVGYGTEVVVGKAWTTMENAERCGFGELGVTKNLVVRLIRFP